MLSEDKLIELCHKYRMHTLTEVEFRKLQAWIDESEENHLFFSNYVKLYKAEARSEAGKLANASAAWAAIQRKRKQIYLRHRIYFISAAACFCSVLLGTAIYLGWWGTPQLPQTPDAALTELFPVLPQNKVTLTLSSGQQIVLDKDSMQTISDKGTVVASGTNQVLDYQNVPAQSMVAQYNTVAVPGGSTFSLTLSDGTKVTLNSSTTLRYPVTFNGNRSVELSGEAYFDVTHTGSPFVVKVDGREIEVLGTRFNISAYRSRNLVATLVEGKVAVKNGTMHRQLSPGQQATLNVNDNTLSVEEVDTDLYTSWTTGKYDFSDTPLRTILTQFELWYGVRITYKDERVKNLRFDGTVFRQKPLGFSLEIIQQVSDVRFTRSGETIVVSQNK